MRVIAGSARSLKLKTLEGIDTRPTTDRIKETLFNMIAPYLYDCEFLDLFAGSGRIGTRGTQPRRRKEAVFVDENRQSNAAACITGQYPKFTRLERCGITLTSDRCAESRLVPVGRQIPVFDLYLYGSALRTGTGKAGTEISQPVPHSSMKPYA